MLFNTIDFVIFFLIVVSTVVIVKHRKFQHLFILIASYFFFYYTSNYLITLLIFTTIWDFYFGNFIYKSKNIRSKKLILVVSLAGNLGLLGFFKYTDFAIMQFNFLAQHFDLGTQIPLLYLVLPIGISFYTFHSITYTVSIYRGIMEPAKSFTEYAIFVAFFPQLVAGPILRAYEFLPQLRDNLKNSEMGKRLRLIVLHNHNLKLGITLMAFGFFKKMFFADNISPMINTVFSNPTGLESLTIIFATIGFGIQIYADFSGYSDIAIGSALILGFKIPINFNKPYFATSPSDFWRRWHISLSTWLRDYLYVPLGGNRKSPLRTYTNLIIVMFLGGLWHGASWNFVIWGLLHGLYLSIHRILTNKFTNNNILKFFSTTSGKLISVLVTQYFVFLAWIPFRVRDVDYMLYSMEKYILFDFEWSNTFEFISTQKLPFVLMFSFLILNYFTFRKKNLPEQISQWKLKYWFIFLIIIISLIIFFYDGEPENFIYFQF